MVRICYHSTNIFQEAIDHCRWKKVVRNVLQKIDISNYKTKTFEEIISYIYSICENIRGIGLLTVYDITSAICRYYKIDIEKVYIVGNGPKRAVSLLHIKTKKHKINDKINISYVDISDVIHAFANIHCEIDETIRNTSNGDIVETYLCNWQKSR
jgi:hypothetical protein